MRPGLDDAGEWATLISAFLRRAVESAGAKGVVIGMSGGADSAVVAALAVRAVGKDGVLGVAMPAPDSEPKDRADAGRVASHLGIQLLDRPIGPILRGLEASGGALGPSAGGNAKARARMMMLYNIGAARNLLVCGTGNKSELLVGYFSKYGDGGVDLQPIGDLYKTQVWRLAEHLGLPKWVVEKAPSAGLRRGQTDEGDLGMKYVDLDRVLKGFELNQSVDEIARRTGVAQSEVERIEMMVRRTEHKRQMPLIPKLGARTVGIDWRRSVQWDA